MAVPQQKFQKIKNLWKFLEAQHQCIWLICLIATHKIFIVSKCPVIILIQKTCITISLSLPPLTLLMRAEMRQLLILQIIENE